MKRRLSSPPVSIDRAEMTSRSTNAGSSQHPAPSSSSGSRKVRAIFLSHSGKQKAFVERLDEALRRVNHDPFFDRISLRKGQEFPEDIKIAARECTLGVVVLSEDFVMSKWPMIELEILVQQRGPNAKLLPLFYKLAPADLNSLDNLVKWRKKWEEVNDYRDEIDKEKVVEGWERSLKALRRFNGELYMKGTSKGEYIKRLVKSICTQVSCPLRYDMSETVGHERLAQIIAGKFDSTCCAWQDGGACMVGLHGVGGLGKSTLCKSMANFYSSMYPGKYYHLELPTKDCDMGIIVEKCKQALGILTDLDDDYLKKVHDFDQVIELMKEHLTRHDVFLAIDNVWESSQTAVRRIVKVGFSSGSKILVTSRSEELLCELLSNQKKSRVDPLPAPDDEEAFQIFQQAFGLGDLNSLLAKGRAFINCVLQKGKYDNIYHALALKALGMYVKNARPLRGWQHCTKDDLSSIVERIGIAGLTSVDDVIRLTYDSLREHRKRVFLDIALLPFMRFVDGRLLYEHVCEMLSALYKKQSPEAIIRELCLGGLLQLEMVGYPEEMVIRVHDLLFDLAEREVPSSARFFMAGISTSVVEQIQWQEVERVILSNDCTRRLIEQVQWRECPKLQVLDASGVTFSEEIDMRRMPALCVLNLQGVRLRSIQNWSASTLAIVSLDDVLFLPIYAKKTSKGEIEDLAMTHVEHRMRYNAKQAPTSETSSKEVNEDDLDTLQMHQCLDDEGRKSLGIWQTHQSPLDLAGPFLERMFGGNDIWRWRGLFGLTCLQSLTIAGCDTPEEVGMSGLTLLQSLTIVRCHTLKEVDMSGITLLKTIKISFCSGLERISDLSGLTSLDHCSLAFCTSLTELGGLSSTLRSIDISACLSLKKVPNISNLTCLETLVLSDNIRLEEVEGHCVSSILENLRIERCLHLRKFPEELERFRLQDSNDFRRTPEHL